MRQSLRSKDDPHVSLQQNRSARNDNIQDHEDVFSQLYVYLKPNMVTSRTSQLYLIIY